MMLVTAETLQFDDMSSSRHHSVWRVTAEAFETDLPSESLDGGFQ